MRKVLQPYIISAAITFVVMSLIAIAIPDDAQQRGTFITGVIVFFVILAMPIYSIDTWSLRKRTIVHAVAMLVTILPCLVVSGWFDVTTWQGIIMMTLTYIGFGAVGWTVGYVVNRIREKKSRETN